MEDDWLMRQVKLVGEGIGHILKKQNNSFEFGEFENENGETVSRKKAILDYIESEQYEQAFLLVNSLKYKLSVYDFDNASIWFIRCLNSINKQNPDTIEIDTIERYSKALSHLM
ncbi:hypothetical protein [Candidatus Enterococcus mansonii]|uniref:Uncharacterized protein n=1 Tax=Candidatus Enterococcus mansonii TaxID=1834181 RepID=A0A242CIZ2_9ENTE|nr:hypothetical protein [Enterococcus sp. 4G2_DIV0659]OTO10217.1 hypothetical protein A5880_000901 [Enterococcus sp. 4G2_DIV0659]